MMTFASHVGPMWMTWLAQAEPAAPDRKTVLEVVHSGGPIGYVIVILSIVALALVILHLVTIRRDRLMPPAVLDQVDQALSRRDVAAALAICQDPANNSFLTRVLAQGLRRYQRSPMGALEIRDAIEEAGTEQVARLYRQTDALGLIAAIAPMLGLLGTVVGMVGAFDTISVAEARPELLAGDISEALVTTLLGLLVAIPVMAIFTYIRNRIDAHAAEVAGTIEDLVIPLESPAAPAPRRAAAPAKPANAAAVQTAPEVRS